MEEKKKFDKRKYDIEYIKTHKKTFKVDLNISEYEELEKILLNKNLTKAKFLRDSIENLKKS